MTAYYFSKAGVFLLHTIFYLYILIVLLRFLLQLVRADFSNPISQFVLKATSPLLMPMRRFIPGWRGVDFSSLVLLIILQAVQIWLVNILLGIEMSAFVMCLQTIGNLLKTTVWIFIAAILIQILTSWIGGGSYNPITALLYQLTDPLLGPARRLLPPLGGLDLSPILVLISLQLVLILVVAPIMDYGVTRLLF